MMNSINGLDGTQELLIKLLEQNPDDWGMRKKVVWFLYEAGYFREASKVVWNAPEIPPADKEVVFAARVVSKGQPTRAMRLLNAVVERNRAEPEKNLEMAKELVRGGMPLQAARFYGAATLSDSSLIDEEFEVCLITADADEEDWSEVVQGEEFPWDGPIELTEADLACSDEGDDSQSEIDMMAGMTQPVPLKAPVQSMKDTVMDEEKAVDLRIPQKPRPLNPDKISTEAVTLSTQNQKDDAEIEEEKELVAEKEPVSEEVEKVEKIDSEADVSDLVSEDKTDDSEELADIEQLKDHTSAVVEVAADEVVEDVTEDVEVNDLDEESEIENLEDEPESAEEDDPFDSLVEPEPVAAKKGVLSSLMGFFRRSKKVEDVSDADILNAPEQSDTATAIPAQPSAFTPPAGISPIAGASPIAGPVKPKPVPVPAELQGTGGRQYGQPEAIDCRTRLVALAPQDGSAFFSELSERYATLPSGKMPAPVDIARNEVDIDYIDLIQQACSNDKSINLDAFSKLLGLHAAMTEADCTEWVEDMNLLRQGFGDAVLATVVSKYSVSECREILGAVYRRTATQAAV